MLHPASDIIIASQDKPAADQGQNGLNVIIVGSNCLQNELLKAFLEQQITGSCRVIQAEDVRRMPQKASLGAVELFLLDCHGIPTQDILIKLALGHPIVPSTTAVALFNVHKGGDIQFERQAIEKQFRGIFYLNDPPQRLVKGIEKILQGELWYTRKTTSRILMESQGRLARTETAQARLTPREKELLISIASGATNNEMADTFCISPHTVKNHLYNIYKKIDVSNRLGATLWVARYL